MTTLEWQPGDPPPEHGPPPPVPPEVSRIERLQELVKSVVVEAFKLGASTSEAKPAKGAGKYHGEVAEDYDAKREDSPKWKVEQRIIEDMLSDLPSGDWVLDCPVGTGRFIPFYESKDFQVIGMDMSGDMLDKAREKVTKPNKIRLVPGNVLKTDRGDDTVDASVMVRLTRWLSPDECRQAIRELARVTRKRIIFTTRIRHRIGELSRPLDLFEVPGWHVARDEQGHEPDYRIVMMESDGG